MTEREWLGCLQPAQMFLVLQGKASDRQLVLFACACVRRSAIVLASERARQALETVERFAEGSVSAADLVAWYYGYSVSGLGLWGPVLAALVAGAAQKASGMLRASSSQTALAALRLAKRVAVLAQEAAGENLVGVDRRCAERLERGRQCNLLRCLFGNPFRRVLLEPAWLTVASGAVAQAAYDERRMTADPLDPTSLAVLADALEEVGCVEQTVLSHLRGPGPHVRGCWAVDLLLPGREADPSVSSAGLLSLS